MDNALAAVQRVVCWVDGLCDSVWEPEDAADAPLLLTVERGEAALVRWWQFHSIGCGLRIGTLLGAGEGTVMAVGITGG